jgi:hypothetical protein
MAFNINLDTAITESVLSEDKLNISLFFSFSCIERKVLDIASVFRIDNVFFWIYPEEK